jgi:hypothetical protein
MACGPEQAAAQFRHPVLFAKIAGTALRCLWLRSPKRGKESARFNAAHVLASAATSNFRDMCRHAAFRGEITVHIL